VILVGTGFAILIAVIAVWINHNLFFNIKNGIGTCQNHFVAAIYAVADVYLKPWYQHQTLLLNLVYLHTIWDGTWELWWGYGNWLI
jgi:hypothetical protein